MQEGLEHLLITERPAGWCGGKLEQVEAKAGRVDFGVLGAENVGALPSGDAGLIVLRSVLPRWGDVPGFLAGCTNALAPGGLLICDGPYCEGRRRMGFQGKILEVQIREQRTEVERGGLAYFTGGRWT